MLSFRGLAWRGAIVLALALPAAALLVVACASASNDEGAGSMSTSDGGVDSGFRSDAPAFDALGSPDGSAEGSAFVPTTALFVQASPSLPDVRLCWATSGTVTGALPFPSEGSMPGSNYPGVPLGGVVPMSDASMLVGGDVTLYAIDAENLAKIEQGTTPSSCADLVCETGSTSCLRANLDYWPIAILAAGGLEAHADNVVALSGCLGSAIDPNASAARCGPTWDAVAGNLHSDVLQLLRTPDAGLSMSVQAAQLSSALAGFEGEGGTTVVSFGAEGALDASLVATLHGEGDISGASRVSLGGDLSLYGQLGFAVDVVGYEGGAGHTWMSLAESLELVDPTQDPTQFFGQRATYLVAVLGDPAAPHAFGPVVGDAGYTGQGLHVLVVAAPSPEGGPADAAVTADALAGDP